MDLIFEDCSPRRAPLVPGTPRAPAAEVQLLAGAYQDPESASIWEIEAAGGRLVARVNRAQELALAPVRRLMYRASDRSAGLTLEFILDEGGAVNEVRGQKEGVSFTLKPFLARPLSPQALAEYVGAYQCQELHTTFLVDVVENQIRLRNENRHFCSMDLVYDPTIADSFVAYDPHPVASQITFLRHKGRVRAFVYRDYDGERREDLAFLKVKEDRP